MDFDFPPDIIMLRDMLRRFVQKDARPLEMKYFTSSTLELEERKAKRALCTMCIGVGQGIAVALERV